MPLLEFDNNEAYGVVQGLTMWWLCSLSAGDDFLGQCGQSVIRNLVVWHVMRYAYYGYPGYNYVFDNARVYGDASQFGAVRQRHLALRRLRHRRPHHPQLLLLQLGRRLSAVVAGRHRALREQLPEDRSTASSSAPAPRPGACPTCDLPDPTTVLNNNRLVAPAGRPLRTVSMDWYTNGQDAANADRLVACNHGGVAGQHFEVFWPQKANAPCATTRPDVDDGYVCATALATSICSGAVDTTPPDGGDHGAGGRRRRVGRRDRQRRGRRRRDRRGRRAVPVDGGALGPKDTAAPYTGCRTPAPSATAHIVVTAVARDVAGNTATSAPVR